MSNVNDLELQHIRKQMLAVRAGLAVRPVLTPIKSVYNPLWFVQVVLGQTLAGVPVIQYAPDPLTAPTAYNPATATSYVVGLGKGILFNANGQQLPNPVIIRHNFAFMTDPFIVGCCCAVSSTPGSVPVTGGGTIPVYAIVRII
jgi:hypothetical protein